MFESNLNAIIMCQIYPKTLHWNRFLSSNLQLVCEFHFETSAVAMINYLIIIFITKKKTFFFLSHQNFQIVFLQFYAKSSVKLFIANWIETLWRCGASVVIVLSNHMIVGTIRRRAAIYKVSSCKIYIA